MERGSRIDSLKNMLEKEPNDLFLNFALGLEYVNDANTLSFAEHQYNFVLSLDSTYIAAYYQLGKLYEATDRKKEALETYHKGLEMAKQQKNNKAINEFSEAVFMLED